MATTISPTQEAVIGAALEARPVAFDVIPRSSWDRLLARTWSPTPFSRWNFHRAWWDAYGETAHEQYLAVVPEDSGPQIDWERAIAIVPLMHRHEVEPGDAAEHTVLRPHDPTCSTVPGDAKAIFFGASYHADYASVLAAPADLPAVADALATALFGPPDPAHGPRDWDVVDLRRLRPADPALVALEAAFRDPTHGWYVAREKEDVCPVITTPSGDWDEYLATLDKKDRHEIRRKMRRAEAVGEMTIEVSTPAEEAIEAFIELHRARFGENGLFPDNAGGERSRRFVQRLAQLECDDPQGHLQVGLVRCGGRLVFAMVAFDDGQTCFLYNAGIEPTAREVSPGITGAAMYFKDRMAAGRRRFDFLRGAEPYKYEWGAVDEPIERLLVTRP
ncbi:MAG: GNAT family N-acetyltransferase [Chloroflexota bacterium]